MGRLQKGGWGIAVAVGLSLAPQLRAGDTTADPAPATQKSDGGSWLGSWLGAKEKPNTSKAPASDKTKKPAGPGAEKHDPPEDHSAERAREQAALLRRLTVCDQLRTVAARKQDDALMRRADALDERAWEIYTRRVAHLPTGRAVVEPGAGLPEPSARDDQPIPEGSKKPKGK